MQGAVISLKFLKIYVLLLIISLRIYSFFHCKTVSPEKKMVLGKKKIKMNVTTQKMKFPVEDFFSD